MIAWKIDGDELLEGTPLLRSHQDFPRELSSLGDYHFEIGVRTVPAIEGRIPPPFDDEGAGEAEQDPPTDVELKPLHPATCSKYWALNCCPWIDCAFPGEELKGKLYG